MSECSLWASSFLGSADVCGPLGHGHFSVKQNYYEVQTTGDSPLREVKNQHHTVVESQPPLQILMRSDMTELILL